MSIRGLTSKLIRFQSSIALAIAVALFSAAPTAQATQRGTTTTTKRAAAAKRSTLKVKVTRRYKSPSKRSKVAKLDATKYANYKKSGLALLRKYPPETHFILGVGRSPVGPVSFLKELNIDGKPVSGDLSALATSVPASSMKSAVPDDRQAEFFRHFERFLPKDVLQGKRKVVLVDWVIGGQSVINFKDVLEAYYKKKKVNNTIIMSGFYNDADEATATTKLPDFDFIGKAADYGMNVSDGDGKAEFDGSHVVGGATNGKVEDLKPNAAHVTFRRGMRRSMEEDQELDKILRTEFKHLLEAPKPRRRVTSTRRAAPALARPTKSSPQAAVQP